MYMYAPKAENNFRIAATLFFRQDRAQFRTAELTASSVAVHQRIRPLYCKQTGDQNILYNTDFNAHSTGIFRFNLRILFLIRRNYSLVMNLPTFYKKRVFITLFTKVLNYLN